MRLSKRRVDIEVPGKTTKTAAHIGKKPVKLDEIR
jgi:hypothetical protein